MFFSLCESCAQHLRRGQYQNVFHFTSRRFLQTFVHYKYRQKFFLSKMVTCAGKLNPCLQMSTSSFLLREHTTKAWKFIARDGLRPEANEATATEEGKGAIPHSVLMTEILKCPTVASQIDTFCSLVSITPEDMERRRAFCLSLQESFSIYFSQFKVIQFGSGINGLGFKGCDTDVCIQTNFNNKDYVTLKEVPKLSDVRDGTISRETVECMTPLYIMRFVRRILREHCPDIKEPILLIKARCPILRFYDAKYDVFCDFSCESIHSLRNTKLIRLLCSLDERFSRVAKVIRYWGKYGGFVGDIEQFNSYSFSLLVAHFLQTRSPPVLPPMNKVTMHSEYLQYGEVDDTNLLLKDLKKFSPSRNSDTVDDLLKEFFYYYLTFDFSRVLLLYSSSTEAKDSFLARNKDSGENFEFSAVNVQDPFRHSFNVTFGASFKSCKRFLNGLIEACEVYQNGSFANNTSNWGLCSLFHRPITEHLMAKKWHENLLHSVHLPSVPDAAEKLKNIFEIGLLFKCIEFCVDKDPDIESESRLLSKLFCKAYFNVWQGRNWAAELYENSEDNILDKEHFISSQLASKAQGKRQILCEFNCELHEIKSGNSRPSLILKLSFMESKFPPIVAIFLKEYLLSVFRKL